MRQCEGLRRATDTVPPDGRQKRGHYLAYEIFHLPASRSHTPRGPTTVLGPSRVSIQRAGGLDSPSRAPTTQSLVKTSSFKLETMFDLQARTSFTGVWRHICAHAEIYAENKLSRPFTYCTGPWYRTLVLYLLCDQI